jgi:hypothetical protein
MTTFLSPGVYSTENDLSQYLANTSTTVTALIGTADKGPLNSFEYITSETQLLRIYGNPNPNSFLLYAARKFLTRGRQLRMVRVASSSALKSSVSILGSAQPAYYLSPISILTGIDLSVTDKVNITVTGVQKEIDLLTGWAGLATSG